MNKWNKSSKDLEGRLGYYKFSVSNPYPTIKIKTEKKLRVGYDLDGVFYNFGASLRFHLMMKDINKYNYKTCPDPQSWEFWEEWNMPVEEWLEHCHAGADAGLIFTSKGWNDNQLQKDVLSVASLKKILDCEIVIVTDRHFGSSPEVSHKATEEWLANVKFPYDELIFSADKTEGNADFFIDDRPSNCETLDNAGVDVVMFDRPWNKQSNPNIKRVNSIVNFNTYILEKAWQQEGSEISSQQVLTV